GVGAGPGAADDERLRPHVGPGLDAGRRTKRTDADLVRNAAEPAELRGLVKRPFAAAEQRIEERAAGEAAEGRAILGPEWVEAVRRLDRAGARHVLHDNGRVSGDVAADVAAERAGVEVVATARGVADHQVDAAPAVEVGHGVRLRANAGAHERQRYQCQGAK